MAETTNTGSRMELLQIGEFARAVGKTVRAIHLYEELGLLQPARRSKGGFRLYHPDSIARVEWIGKLQAIGFSLTEIQGFVRQFEEASSGRDATAHVREVFLTKRAEIREQIARLQSIDSDLDEALQYLDACGTCSPAYGPHACHACDHEGHEPTRVPELFAGLSESFAEAGEPREVERAYDVELTQLAARSAGNGSQQ